MPFRLADREDTGKKQSDQGQRCLSRQQLRTLTVHSKISKKLKILKYMYNETYIFFSSPEPKAHG